MEYNIDKDILINAQLFSVLASSTEDMNKAFLKVLRNDNSLATLPIVKHIIETDKEDIPTHVFLIASKNVNKSGWVLAIVVFVNDSGVELKYTPMYLEDLKDEVFSSELYKTVADVIELIETKHPNYFS